LYRRGSRRDRLAPRVRLVRSGDRLTVRYRISLDGVAVVPGRAHNPIGQGRHRRRSLHDGGRSRERL